MPIRSAVQAELASARRPFSSFEIPIRLAGCRRRGETRTATADRAATEEETQDDDSESGTASEQEPKKKAPKKKKKKRKKKQSPDSTPSAEEPAIPTAPPAEVRLATVQLVGVRMAPWKNNAKPWDFTGEPQENDVRAFGEALRDLSLGTLEAKKDVKAVASMVRAVGAVTALLASPTVEAFGALTRPDVTGTATLTRGSTREQPRQLIKIDDSYTPQWNVTWKRVPLDGSARIEVSLSDADGFTDDPIGTFFLSKPDFELALAAGEKTFEVGVADQTGDQVAIAQLAVFVE